MSTSTAVFKKVLGLPPALRRTLWTTSNNADIYDVVCVGGGPAGLSFVSALQSHPSTKRLRIALIDSQALTASRPASETTTYSNRCSSLTPSSVHFLKEIGAWKHVDGGRTTPYHCMDVWDGVSGSKIHFDPLDSQQPGILETVAEAIPGQSFKSSQKGYDVSGHDGTVATMCENSNLTAALLERLKVLNTDAVEASLKMQEKTRVESIVLGPQPETDTSLDLSQWPIVNTSQGPIAARVLVGADGANSPVRHFADIPSQGWDYNQHGVVATLDLDRSFSEGDLRTAYQRFLPTGPIALLPLPDNKASLVWSITAPQAAKLKQLSPRDFTAMASAAFRLLPADIDYLTSHLTSGQSEEVAWRETNTQPSQTGLPPRFPRIVSVQENSIASFPLRMRHASTYVGHRIALIGDAAHTVHPLAGQGLNLGLADAEALAKHITYGVEHGMDIGSNWCLDGYNGERWAANNAMLGVVDKLQKLYSVGGGPVVWARSLGLEAVNRLQPLKGALMGIAAGIK